MSYCDWDQASEECIRYHNEEWGVPLHDERGQFEFLTLEVMQCGLSWELMIRKREIFRKCFENFDFDKIALYGEKEELRIMNTPGMIRSIRKIRAIIQNARCFCEIRREYGSFSNFLWGYSDGRTIIYDRHPDGFIPVSNGLSERISSDLKKRGFKYLGPITIYSHLQACGIINDHSRDCEIGQRINSRYPTCRKHRDHEKQVSHF